MREMRDTMEAALHQINEAAESVDTGSTQVASNSQMLSEGVTEQVSSIEELTATTKKRPDSRLQKFTSKIF